MHGVPSRGVRAGPRTRGNREAKRDLVVAGTVRQILVYDDDVCVGWCQYGTPDELPNIKNRKKYDAGAVPLPTCRIGCIFTAGKRRGHGVARAGVRASLQAISHAGVCTV